MTYPAGVQTSKLTFSNPKTHGGKDADRTEITVQPTASIVWAETGEPLDDFAETVAPSAGSPGVFTAPCVDQLGVRDQAGNAFTMWAYIITRRSWLGGVEGRPVRKTWQPLLGQPDVDFDTLPGGSIGLPVSVPIPPVYAVNGKTGSVTVIEATPENVDAVLPPRLSEESLTATFATSGEIRSVAKADGTDQTAAIQSELAALAAGQGGTLRLPSGVIRINGRLTIPYTLDGTGAPVQPAIAIRGNGKRAHGRGSGIDLTPTGGTVLDMRWSDPDLKKARFQSNGFGYLEICDITFTDQGAVPSGNPFIKHTNTVVNIHDIAGIGSPSLSGLGCTQDLVIAGGHTMPAEGDFSLDDDAPFQGYGSEYRNIWHNRIRRAVVLGAYANQVKVNGVYGWQKSGNPDGGSVEIDPGPTSTQGVNGVEIANVLSESLYYKYGVYARKLSRSVLSNIGSYDYHGNTTYTAAIGLHSCDSLTIIAGYDDLDGIKPYVAVAAGSAFNNWRDMCTLIHSSQSVNAPGTSWAAKFLAWMGITTRAEGGGAGVQLRFSRAGDATTGPQVGFANYGRKWQTDGTGGPMEIDTGTGGSYFDLKAYGMRWYSHTGALRGVFGAGKDGFTLGAAGDVSIERHAAGVVKSNGRLRGEGGISAAVMSTEPIPGTIDNGEVVFYLDPTPGATKVKIIAKDSGGTVRRGEIALA